MILVLLFVFDTLLLLFMFNLGSLGCSLCPTLFGIHLVKKDRGGRFVDFVLACENDV